MKRQWELVTGDNKPDMEFTITNQQTGAAIPLTGHTVNFYLRKVAGDGSIVNTGHTACTHTDATNGVTKYEWADDDLDDDGDYEGEIEITYSSGKIQTYPKLFYFIVRGGFA